MSEIEPFVDASKGAEFLGITRRRVLELARGGEIPGYSIGLGKRKTWRFRLSELADAIAAEKGAVPAPNGISSTRAVPRQPNRRN